MNARAASRSWQVLHPPRSLIYETILAERVVTFVAINHEIRMALDPVVCFKWRNNSCQCAVTNIFGHVLRVCSFLNVIPARGSMNLFFFPSSTANRACTKRHFILRRSWSWRSLRESAFDTKPVNEQCILVYFCFKKWNCWKRLSGRDWESYSAKPFICIPNKRFLHSRRQKQDFGRHREIPCLCNTILLLK